jgi:chorismate synthase
MIERMEREWITIYKGRRKGVKVGRPITLVLRKSDARVMGSEEAKYL